MNCFYNDNCILENTDDCNTSCIRYAEIQFLLNSSLIPENRQRFVQLLDKNDYTGHEFIREIAGDIKTFINNGENLIIYSKNLGNGKTTSAINVMLSYFDTIWAGNGFRPRGYFIHVPTYINRCKSNISHSDLELEEIKTKINTIDLIILDDLGSMKLSDYDNSILSSIIDQRCLNQKSIIVTTNCDKQQLQTNIGSRLVDRLYSTASVIEFCSPSYRGIV